MQISQRKKSRMARRKSKAKRSQGRGRTRATHRPLTPLSRPGRFAGRAQVQRLVAPTIRVPGTSALFRGPVVGLRPPSVVPRRSIPPPKPLQTPFERLRSHYRIPKQAEVCVRRKERKEVLMAKFGGKGPKPAQQKKRRLGRDSHLKC